MFCHNINFNIFNNIFDIYCYIYIYIYIGPYFNDLSICSKAHGAVALRACPNPLLIV